MIHTFDDHLATDSWRMFVHECNTRKIQFEQTYPGRIMSLPTERDWLLQHFQSSVDRLGRDRPVQQIFLSLEMPGSRFAMHRSHPAIDQILIYSMDDSSHELCLRQLTNTQDVADDYWDPDLATDRTVTSIDHMVRANRLFVIDNSGTRSHWGSNKSIATGVLQRFVWIYLG